MIRLIFRETDCNDAAHVGGPVFTRHRTFDVNLPEVEAWLRECEPKPKMACFLTREIVGVELVAAGVMASVAIDADTLFGLRRYLNDVLESGTVNEQGVARTALRMIATPPALGVAGKDDKTEDQP